MGGPHTQREGHEKGTISMPRVGLFRRNQSDKRGQDYRVFPRKMRQGNALFVYKKVVANVEDEEKILTSVVVQSRKRIDKCTNAGVAGSQILLQWSSRADKPPSITMVILDRGSIISLTSVGPDYSLIDDFLPRKASARFIPSKLGFRIRVSLSSSKASPSP